MFGRYEIGEQPVPGFFIKSFLGAGSFGSVYSATGPGGSEVAIKRINLQQYGDKELRALRLVKRIRHPNVVPLTGFWLRDQNGELIDDATVDRLYRSSPDLAATLVCTDDGTRPAELIVVMGLADMSLEDRLRECQKQGQQGITVDELLRYMDDAARAIDFLNKKQHRSDHGLVAIQHCDIKPQNILIVGGAAQLCDLGLARILDDARQTRAAFSAAYGAPECLTGSSPSAGTDQYSLAVSYVELRTGQLPFEDPSSHLSVIQAHVESRLDLKRLTPSERAVIRRATSKNPTDRYDTVQSMVDALRQAALRGEAPKATTSRGGRRMVTILALMTVACIAAVGVWTVSRWTPWQSTISQAFAQLRDFTTSKNPASIAAETTTEDAPEVVPATDSTTEAPATHDASEVDAGKSQENKTADEAQANRERTSHPETHPNTVEPTNALLDRGAVEGDATDPAPTSDEIAAADALAANVDRSDVNVPNQDVPLSSDQPEATTPDANDDQPNDEQQADLPQADERSVGDEPIAEEATNDPADEETSDTEDARVNLAAVSRSVERRATQNLTALQAVGSASLKWLHEAEIEADSWLVSQLEEQAKQSVERGRDEEAIALYTQLLHRDRDHLSARTQRGLAYVRLGQFTDAMNDYSQIIELDRSLAETADAYRLRGVARAKHGDLPGAQSDLTMAIDRGVSALAGSHRMRALVRLQQKQYAEALSDAAKMAELDAKLLLVLPLRVKGGEVWAETEAGQKLALEDGKPVRLLKTQDRRLLVSFQVEGREQQGWVDEQLVEPAAKF